MRVLILVVCERVVIFATISAALIFPDLWVSLGLWYFELLVIKMYQLSGIPKKGWQFSEYIFIIIEALYATCWVKFELHCLPIHCFLPFFYFFILEIVSFKYRINLDMKALPISKILLFNKKSHFKVLLVTLTFLVMSDQWG